MSEFPLLCIRGDECHTDGPRPTEQRAWFCHACEDRMRANLEHIAAAWDDLEAALTSSEVIYGEQGKQKHGGKTHGIRLSDAAVEARAKATAVTWFMVRDLLDRYDEQGRDLPIPRDQSTPSVAAWLAKWHVPSFAAHPGDQLALEVYDDLAETRRLVTRGAYPLGVRRIELGLPCDQHATSEVGKRVPCEGSLYATVARKGSTWSDLRCTADPEHVVPTTEWMHGSWQRKRVRAMDPRAALNFARQIATRHTSEDG